MTSSEVPAVAAPKARGSLRSTLLVVLAGLCVLLAVAAVVFGVRLRDYAETQQDRSEALGAARQSALNLTSIDTEDFDAAVQRVLEGATGDFRQEFEDNSANLDQLLADNEVSAEGQVIEAGLVRADASNATALVVVDSTVRNTATPDGRVNTYRMQIDVERVAGRWLTSSLRFVG
jgi:Mce-associated membrane protein